MRAHVIGQRSAARGRNVLQKLRVTFFRNRERLEREPCAPQNSAMSNLTLGADDHPIRREKAALRLSRSGFRHVGAERRGIEERVPVLCGGCCSEEKDDRDQKSTAHARRRIVACREKRNLYD